MEAEAVKVNKKRGLITWIKRIGFWGFIFFLVKGLVWLGIFIYGYFALKK